MFNIADGGFTELHALWQNEQAALVPGMRHVTCIVYMGHLHYIHQLPVLRACMCIV